MSIEDIKTMIDKEVRDRIKKAEWLPIDDVKTILKLHYEEFTNRINNVVMPFPLLDEAYWRMKKESKIEGLLEIIETAKFGSIKTGTIKERYEAVK